MNERSEINGEIFEERKSLYLLLSSPEGEQIVQLVPVKISSSKCVQFGLWQEYLENLELEFELSNQNQFDRQVNSLLDLARSHLKSDCDCPESLNTIIFRGFKISKMKQSIELTLMAFDNRKQGVIDIPIIVSTTLESLLDEMNVFLSSVISNLGQDIFRDYNFSDIKYTPRDVILSLGEQIEYLLTTQDFQASNPLKLKIENMLKQINLSLENPNFL